MGRCRFLDVQRLSADGRYAVVVEPEGAATADTTLTVYDVPP
jgi:hypothetical protein